MDRVINGFYSKLAEGQIKKSDLHKKPHRRSLKAEKQARKENKDYQHSQSEKVMKKLLKEADNTRIKDFQAVLDDLMVTIGIIPSLQEKDELIINRQKLIISGDGSILATAASPVGKPACNCRKQKIYNCNHPRDYTTATAQWCYDAAHDKKIFGDRYYLLTLTQNGHDHPLLTIMPGGNESDYTLSLKAVDRFLKVIREHELGMKIDIFTGDGHHDANAHYIYFEKKHIRPVIPLREGSKTVYPHLKNKNITLNEEGVPICPGGMPMRWMGYNKNKYIHTYNCPAKRNTHREGKCVYIFHQDECPKQAQCQPGSTIGPCVYIKSDEDPRLFPQIARNSKKFKMIYNQRSATERGNSVLDSYNLDRAHRCPEFGLIRITFANIMVHAVNRYNNKLQKSSKQKLFNDALQKVMAAKKPAKPKPTVKQNLEGKPVFENSHAFWNL